MFYFLFARLAIVLASLAGTVVLYASTPQPEFVAAWRTGGTDAALIDAAGRIHFYGSTGVKRTLVLSVKGKPATWRHVPTSFVRFGSEWIVADGTSQLRRFSADGELVATLTTPAPLSDLTIAGKTIWGANFLAAKASKLLWSSADGRVFSSFRLNDEKGVGGIAAMYRSQVIIAGSSAGELFLARLIDAPVVHRVFPLPRTASWPLAYSRSKARNALFLVKDGIDDPTVYSTPVRDMVVTVGGLLVLRNREDVKSSGKIESQQGLRVDRYDGTGRHVASAVFPEPMKWILLSDTREVAAVTGRGAVRTAPWGKPIAGGIVR